MRVPRRYLLSAATLGAVVLPAVASFGTSPTIEAVNEGSRHRWSPTQVSVAVAGAVTIRNSTEVPHGVEWRSGPIKPSCEEGPGKVPVGTTPAASGTKWSGACTFTQAGTYTFFCTVHGSEMTSTITVNTGGAPPTVTKLSPTKGAAGGGTTVTITGANFIGATAVGFGSVSAASFKVNSATSITAVSPAEPAGTVDVRVTTPNGTSAVSSSDHFKFGPTVTNLSPKAGSKAGGTKVTVMGTGFALGTTATVFKFGLTTATSVNCTKTTECTAVSPAHAAGKVDVKATVNTVSSPKNAPADQFTYN